MNIEKDFYISKKGKVSKPSPTEKVILYVLKKYNIRFIREVSFKKFGFASSPYRFDFYLPDYNVIIEYDGEHHSRSGVKFNDKLKNQFCRLNGIKIYRFNKKHYNKLEFHIDKLLKTLTK